MAKRGVLDHPKTMELAERLGKDDCDALGILEAFWEHVARFYPTGDITTLRPSVLARSIRTSTDPELLWESLVAVRLVDVLEDGRAVIHDWPDHCEDSVHMALARKGQYFADGSTPKLTRLPKEDRDAAERTYGLNGSRRAPKKRTEAEGETHAVRTESAQEAQAVRTSLSHGLSQSPCQENLPTPGTSKRDPESTPRYGEFCNSPGSQANEPDEEDFFPPDEPEPPDRGRVAPSSLELTLEPSLEPSQPPPKEPPEVLAAFAEFQAVYPPRDGDRKVKAARVKFARLATTRPAVRAAILAGARRYRAWCDAKGWTGTEKVQQMTTWLNGEAWSEEWAIPPPGSNGSPGKLSFEEQHQALMAELRRSGFFEEMEQQKHVH